MLNFLTTNNITDLSGLDEKLKADIGKQLDLSDRLKKIDRRLKVLDEHIQRSGSYKANRTFKTEYEKLYAQYTAHENSKGFGVQRKAQKALAAANEYYEAHSMEITSYLYSIKVAPSNKNLIFMGANDFNCTPSLFADEGVEPWKRLNAFVKLSDES